MPGLCFEVRKIYNDSKPWRRDEFNSFRYGDFNSLNMTIFTICIFFAPNVPLIPLAASVFLYIKMSIDGYNLLTYYRREIESNGKIIDFVTNTALIVVILYQICMTAYFCVHYRENETIACCILFLLSVFYAAITHESVLDLSKMEESMESQGEFD